MKRVLIKTIKLSVVNKLNEIFLIRTSACLISFFFILLTEVKQNIVENFATAVSFCYLFFSSNFSRCLSPVDLTKSVV